MRLRPPALELFCPGAPLGPGAAVALAPRASPPRPEVVRPAPAAGEPDGDAFAKSRYEWIHQGHATPEAREHFAALMQQLKTPVRRVPDLDPWTQIGPLDMDSLYTAYPTLDKGAGRIV